MILWIIGLAGAGKTTLATEVTNRLREKNQRIVLIDGDLLEKFLMMIGSFYKWQKKEC